MYHLFKRRTWKAIAVLLNYLYLSKEREYSSQKQLAIGDLERIKWESCIVWRNCCTVGSDWCLSSIRAHSVFLKDNGDTLPVKTNMATWKYFQICCMCLWVFHTSLVKCNKRTQLCDIIRFSVEQKALCINVWAGISLLKGSSA